jgi:hypothetical protein
MRQTRRIKKRDGVMAGGAQQTGGTHMEILLEKKDEEPPTYQWQQYGAVTDAVAKVSPIPVPPGAEMLAEHAQEMSYFVRELMADDEVPPGVVATGITKLATILADAENTLTELPRIKPLEKVDANQTYRGLGRAEPPYFTPIDQRNAAEVKRLSNTAARERNADPTFRAEVAEAVRLGMSMKEVREAYGIGWEAMYGILDEAGVPRPRRGNHGNLAAKFAPEEEIEMPTPQTPARNGRAAELDAAVKAHNEGVASQPDKSWRITFVAPQSHVFTAPTLDEAIALVREGYGADVDITSIGRA